MTVAFHNLGCKVNSYEIEKIKEGLLKEGFFETDFNSPSDVYIINTCSVTHIADRKSRNMIRRCKKQNPNSLVVAIGCFVNAMSEEDKNKLKNYVDVFIKNEDKINTINIVKQNLQNKNNLLHCINIECSNTNISSNERIRKFIKIQDGCNMYCSYCIIPYLRHEMINRNENEVVSEVETYVQNNVKEVVLTGIHLSSYKNITCLINKLSNIQKLLRIRIGSLEPRIITKEFLKCLNDEVVKNKFCFEFHLSLQSGSNSVLKRMNRHYTKEEYKQSCDLIREYFPNALISTDIIVGFPGETDEEFNETLEFVKQIRFYNPHIFIYSRRKGTKANTMLNQIEDSIKEKREKELIKITNSISNDIRKSFYNREEKVLIEEFVGEDAFGFTKEYVRVKVPNCNKNVKIGDEISVKMQENCNDFVLALLK